eukprot:scaffold578_cov167-Amphora_coffeaeformis.AAC.1
MQPYQPPIHHGRPSSARSTVISGAHSLKSGPCYSISLSTTSKSVVILTGIGKSGLNRLPLQQQQLLNTAMLHRSGS